MLCVCGWWLNIRSPCADRRGHANPCDRYCRTRCRAYHDRADFHIRSPRLSAAAPDSWISRSAALRRGDQMVRKRKMDAMLRLPRREDLETVPISASVETVGCRTSRDEAVCSRLHYHIGSEIRCFVCVRGKDDCASMCMDLILGYSSAEQRVGDPQRDWCDHQPDIRGRGFSC